MREAACIGIGQFAQFLQPEIITHYQQVPPCTLTLTLTRTLTLALALTLTLTLTRT